VIVPNKVIRLDDSVLSRLSTVLREGTDPVDVVLLYSNLSDAFESIDQFILALDTLFVLGKIHVDFNTRSLTYAG
jgi:hypothetical protein